MCPQADSTKVEVMYVAPVDEGTEEDWHLLLDQTPVVTLVAPGAGGAPVVVPTHFRVVPASGGEPPVIEVHLHRANPFWAAVEADPLLGAIRGVRLRVDEVVVTTKFGGNRPEATRREVAARVRRRDGPGDRAAAAWADRTLDRRGQDG